MRGKKINMSMCILMIQALCYAFQINHFDQINFKSIANKSVTLYIDIWITFMALLLFNPIWIQYTSTSASTDTDMAVMSDYGVIYFLHFCLQNFTLHANAKRRKLCTHSLGVVDSFSVKSNKVEYQMWLGFGKQNL